MAGVRARTRTRELNVAHAAVIHMSKPSLIITNTVTPLSRVSGLTF